MGLQAEVLASVEGREGPYAGACRLVVGQATSECGDKRGGSLPMSEIFELEDLVSDVRRGPLPAVHSCPFTPSP